MKLKRSSARAIMRDVSNYLRWLAYASRHPGQRYRLVKGQAVPIRQEGAGR
jgi:hypothetical protein